MIKGVLLNDLKYFNIDEIDSPFRKYIAFYYDNCIVGYISYDIIYDRVEIINVFVDEKFRNRKIASNMLEYLIVLCKKNNLKNITLEVRKNNIYAIKLYEHFLFKNVAVRKKYYDGIDGILMELSL